MLAQEAGEIIQQVRALLKVEKVDLRQDRLDVLEFFLSAVQDFIFVALDIELEESRSGRARGDNFIHCFHRVGTCLL